MQHAEHGTPHAYLIGGDARILAQAQGCFPAFAWRAGEDAPAPAKRTGLFGRPAHVEPWTARLGPGDVVAVWGAAEAPEASVLQAFQKTP